MPDIIVIGCSAGGVTALSHLVKALPADLPASVFVVMHLPSGYKSLLPDILRREGYLPVSQAEDGLKIERGRMYVAPADYHLLIEDSHMQLYRGPKENHARPAIDPLFRSAAKNHGARVVGVVLTGALYDGTAGLIAIKRHGGTAIVQDPSEAVFASMPTSAISRDHPDFVLTLDEIADVITRLARESS